jgi:hypothetical protein
MNKVEKTILIILQWWTLVISIPYFVVILEQSNSIRINITSDMVVQIFILAITLIWYPYHYFTRKLVFDDWEIPENIFPFIIHLNGLIFTFVVLWGLSVESFELGIFIREKPTITTGGYSIILSLKSILLLFLSTRIRNYIDKRNQED